MTSIQQAGCLSCKPHKILSAPNDGNDGYVVFIEQGESSRVLRETQDWCLMVEWNECLDTADNLGPVVRSEFHAVRLIASD